MPSAATPSICRANASNLWTFRSRMPCDWRSPRASRLPVRANSRGPCRYMVKCCLLVLALATTHSPVAPGVAGAATPAVAAPGTTTPRPHSHAAEDKYLTLRAEAAATLSARADAHSLATAAALRYARPGYGS